MTRLFASALLLILASCNDSTPGSSDPDQPAAGADAPALMTYSIVKTFPHDTSSFTQGLLVYKGEMYEGTGNAGRSHLMKVDVNTGKAIKKIPVEGNYFGEGVTILRDTVYQLTWKDNVVLVYTLPDFKKVKEYKLTTEGWGITTDGTSLIVSDGTSNLYYYDPSTFTLQRSQGVTEGGSLSYNLNELEYINGFIYANQWQQPFIFKINPGSGAIVAKADLSKIWERVKSIDPLADVPNGIAYDSTTKHIYITGKLWPELYQVEFSN